MSIKKIAERAGVSIATVSRILNNPEHKCSSPGIRDVVLKAARELHYVPNEAARKLKKGIEERAEKTYCIDILMTRMDDSESDPFFRELLRVVESEIHKSMCIMSKVWYKSLFSDDKKCEEIEIENIIEEMFVPDDQKKEGLMIIGKCNQKALRKFKKSYKSVVSINRNSTNYEVDEVVCDGKKVAVLAVEHLVKLGHKKIAYVGKCHHEARYSGYREVLSGHQIDINQELVFETEQRELCGFHIMESILQLEEKQKPSAIYCANDITAIGMIKCLNQGRRNYYRPSIIASDDIEEAQYTTPMLSTVRLPKNEMGRFAMWLMLDRLKNGHKSVVRIEVEGTLIDRESCGNGNRYLGYFEEGNGRE